MIYYSYINIHEFWVRGGSGNKVDKNDNIKLKFSFFLHVYNLMNLMLLKNVILKIFKIRQLLYTSLFDLTHHTISHKKFQNVALCWYPKMWWKCFCYKSLTTNKTTPHNNNVSMLFCFFFKSTLSPIVS